MAREKKRQTTTFDVDAYGNPKYGWPKNRTMLFIVGELLRNGNSSKQIEDALDDHGRTTIFKAPGELNARQMVAEIRRDRRFRGQSPEDSFFVADEELVQFDGETFAVSRKFGKKSNDGDSDENHLERIRRLAVQFPEAQIHGRKSGTNAWAVKPSTMIREWQSESRPASEQKATVPRASIPAKPKEGQSSGELGSFAQDG